MFIKNIIYFLFLLFFVNSLNFGSENHKYYIRVLLSTSSFYSLNADNYFLLYGKERIKNTGPLELRYHAKGIEVNGVLIPKNAVGILNSGEFSVNKTLYRGSCYVYRDQGDLCLVNYLDLEDYLLGVLPNEVYSSWAMDTLKAQAVASRSYALYEILQHHTKLFDLDSRPGHSQMYKGLQSENTRTTEAVHATKGQILVTKKEGEVVKAYFSVSCGSCTAEGDELKDSKSYLCSVKVEQHPKNPFAYWEHEIHFSELTQKLTCPMSIVDVNVLERGESGRIKNIQVTMKNGEKKVFNGDKFRHKVGLVSMKSTFADFHRRKSEFLFISGQGYGHGVGMGQWEAEAMAQNGKSYKKILDKFYSGTSIKKLY